jgi:hypothetical protein
MKTSPSKSLSTHHSWSSYLIRRCIIDARLKGHKNHSRDAVSVLRPALLKCQFAVPDLWLHSGNCFTGVRFPAAKKIFLLAHTSRPALGPTQPPIQWEPGALTPGVKRPGREADHSRHLVPRSRTIGVLPPTLVLMAWCFNEYQGQLYRTCDLYRFTLAPTIQAYCMKLEHCSYSPSSQSKTFILIVLCKPMLLNGASVLIPASRVVPLI